MREHFYKKPQKAIKSSWPVNDYATDICKLKTHPAMGDGDGFIYIVHDVLDDYIMEVFEYGGIMTTHQKKNAKHFYDGQEAWGAACNSIYPAEVLIIGEVRDK